MGALIIPGQAALQLIAQDLCLATMSLANVLYRSVPVESPWLRDILEARLGVPLIQAPEPLSPQVEPYPPQLVDEQPVGHALH